MKDYLGHRERLRRRYLQGGIKALNDYEIVELLLFYSIPVRDTKPIAKSLIKRFKNIKGIFSNLENSEVLKINGFGEKSLVLFRLIRDVCIKIQEDEILSNKKLDNLEKVINFAKASIGLSREEKMYLISLNSKNEVIEWDCVASGTVNELYIYPREIVKKALEHNASSVILIHNHPSGDVKPSKEDVKITKKLKRTLEELGILLHDHVIIGASSYFSFRLQGIL